MAIIKPAIQRIWARLAPPSNVVDPDTTTPGKFDAGWVAEVPPFEHFNFLQKLFTEGSAYLNQEGIGEWDTDTVYSTYGIAKGSDGKLYISKLEQSGNDPVSDDGTNWDIFNNDNVFDTFVDLKSGNSSQNTIVTLSSGDRYLVTGSDTGAGIQLDNGNYLEPLPPLSFEHFGASGDGVTDDITAINDTLSYSKSSGKGIVAKPKTYAVSSDINADFAINLTSESVGKDNTSSFADLSVTTLKSIGATIVTGKQRMFSV